LAKVAAVATYTTTLFGAVVCSATFAVLLHFLLLVLDDAAVGTSPTGSLVVAVCFLLL
jgi:hypothetical protein